MPRQYKVLTQEHVDFFMENGFVVIKNAFTREQAAEFSKDVWVRLGVDPNDKSTWNGKPEKTNMPRHRMVPITDISQRAWDAMADLLGGEGRIAINETSGFWGDSFIVNLGLPEYENDKIIDPRDLDNWHVDGDWFVHFLDSPEQALLVTPIFSDIQPRGGGTYLCPEGIPMIAKHLAAHPEGLLPTGLSFTPSTSTYDDPKQHPEYWFHPQEVKKCTHFVEMTGEVGDLVLAHPLMLHSASKNQLRIPRIITNPHVSVREPFNFNRENPDDYSLVELKTLKALGVDSFDFKPTTERRKIVPRRVQIQATMLEEERKRLEALAKAKENIGAGSSSQPVAVA